MSKHEALPATGPCAASIDFDGALAMLSMILPFSRAGIRTGIGARNLLVGPDFLPTK
ncbi:hypothetical protein V6U71_06000 [Sphingopyxis sp. J-6]|uniref:hypothetical protein n=1 Tax=Sphingopyxis sp. J-6 TaxID=3122054 RepID=UPI0039843A57